MRDDPRKNLKWLEQQLLSEDTIHRDFSKLSDTEYHEDDNILELVDMLIGEEAEEEPTVRNFSNTYGHKSRGAQIERSHINQQFDPAAAVLTKTKKQLRKEAKQQKKANVNHNIKGLVFLAVLECIGIFVLLGWWLQ